MAANLPSIEAEGVTPMADLSRSAGAGARATAEMWDTVTASVGKLEHAYQTVEHAHDQAQISKQNAATDADVDVLKAQHAGDVEGFKEALGKYRSTVVGSVAPRYARHAAEYIDLVGTKATGAVGVEHARQDRANSISELKARGKQITTRVGESLEASGGDLDALAGDPQHAHDQAELTANYGALVKSGAMSQGEADIEIGNAQSQWKASAVTGHILKVYREKGADAALADLQAIKAGAAGKELPAAEGMKAPGNLEPWNRPILKNPDGSYSTTSSISVGTDQGEVLIPTVVDGKRLTNEQAVAHFRETGENFGTFDTPSHADAYATELHNRQDKYVQSRGGPDQFTPDNGLHAHEADLAFNKARAALTEEISVAQQRQNLLQTADTQARQDTKRAIDEDTAAVALTGKGTGLTADKVVAGLGIDGLRDWYKKKADALEDHQKYGDLSRLSPSQAAARIASVTAAGTHSLPSTIDNAKDLEGLTNAMGTVETGSNPHRISSEGAVGKYQVMPATAQRISAKLGLPYDAKRLLNDDAYNKQISQGYMSELLTRYQGDSFLAVTAYHAGEGNVDKWIAHYGDPRKVGQAAFLAQVEAAGNPHSAAYPRLVAQAMAGGKAQAAWDGAQKVREEDPAGAVAGDPMVRAAVAKWQNDNQAGKRTNGSGFVAVQAYLDAQDRAGIKAKDRQPLTNVALQEYADSFTEMVKSGDAHQILEWRKSVMAQFSDPAHPQGNGYGARVMQAVLEKAGSSAMAAATLASVTMKTGAGTPITKADQDTLHTSGRVEAMHRAATGASPARVLPREAVSELQKDHSPAAQQEFDAVFGAGAAARALKGG